MTTPIFDFSTRPLVVGRIPGFPLELAMNVLAATDPIEAAREVFSANAAVRLALQTASPSLANAVDQWVAGEPLRNLKTPLRALAYLVRMCARPTPLGLCAGIGPAGVGSSTTLDVDPDASDRRTFARPDMSFMRALGKSLEESDARGRIPYVANTCAIERGGRLYVTNVRLANDQQSHATQRPVSLKNTAAVAEIRAFCKEPVPFDAIAAHLVARFSAEPAQATRLLDQLISAGVLISTLQPSPLGDPVAYLAGAFRTIGAPWIDELDMLLEELKELDMTPLAQRDRADYAHVQQTMSLMAGDEVPHTLQIDMRAPLRGDIHRRVLEDVERYADICVRMSHHTELDELREAFMARYEGAERLVPLLELTDPNTGIRIPAWGKPKETGSDKRDAIVMALLARALRDADEEVELTPDELDVIAPPLGPKDVSFPSIEAGFLIDAESREAIDGGNYRIAPGAFSFTDAATKSLARFAHLFDEDTNALARELAAVYDGTDTVNAELVYAPRDDRAYNVLIRPAWHEHTVTLGLPGSSKATSIDLDDLFVGMHDDRFYLWSRRLGRRVAVRETHVFGTSRVAPDLCRFFLLLHYQDRRVPVLFDWGQAWKAPYLPRVRFGRIVLALRTWSFEAQGLDIARERARWNLPRFVNLVDEDHRLLLDLDSPTTAALVADQAGARERIRLTEAYPSPDKGWLRSREGSYCIEFIAQGCATRVRNDSPPAPAISNEAGVYGPNSSWIFAKFYLGMQAFDQLVVTHLRPLADGLRAEGAIDRWFFVRYNDDHPHMRVRFRALPGYESAVRERVGELASRLLRERFIWRGAFDTYAPEYERYGGSEGMDLVERFFTYDSDRVSMMLGRGIASPDDLIANAAAGALPFLASEKLRSIAIETLAPVAREKLSPADREALRGLLRAETDRIDASFIRFVEAAPKSGKLIADLIHMHCNRLGAEAHAEKRVYGLVRATALGLAQRKAGANQSAPAAALRGNLV